MFIKYIIRKKYIILGIIILLIGFLYWQNNNIVVSKITYKNKQIPKSFNGFKIVQLSDLHNKIFFDNQKSLVNKVVEQKPDIIVITGDLIDKNRTDFKAVELLLKQLNQKYPIYYVSGNHEKFSGKYDSFEKVLLKNKVIVLNNKISVIKKNVESISVLGLEDVSFYAYGFSGENYKQKFDVTLKDLTKDIKGFYFSLSHRPELIKYYLQENIPLILTGHAHGGQVRLPFVGGLVAPNQGLFPKYSIGKYEVKNTTMIVSRGLGNSLFPFRIFNRPEIVVVTFKN